MLTSIMNDEELNESFDGIFTSEEDWFTFKSVVYFPEPASVIINMAVSTSNATLSIQPMMFERLIAHCEDWMEKPTAVDALRSSTQTLLNLHSF